MVVRQLVLRMELWLLLPGLSIALKHKAGKMIRHLAPIALMFVGLRLLLLLLLVVSSKNIHSANIVWIAILKVEITSGLIALRVVVLEAILCNSSAGTWSSGARMVAVFLM
jgi:hypothetical protein